MIPSQIGDYVCDTVTLRLGRAIKWANFPLHVPPLSTCESPISREKSSGCPSKGKKRAAVYNAKLHAQCSKASSI